MNIYYKTPRFCNLCNHPYENVSHVLNGCRELKNIYSKRHNRLIDLIHDKIKPAPNVTVIKDGTLSPNVFQSTNNGSFETTNRRQDITIIKRSTYSRDSSPIWYTHTRDISGKIWKELPIMHWS